MATVNQPDPRPRDPRPRRRARIAAAGVALAVLVALVWYGGPLAERASAGTAYGARVACSCRFVAGRTLDNCRADFLAGMGPVMLSEDAAAKSVTARFPLLASATATYREGAGCVLAPWSE